MKLLTSRSWLLFAAVPILGVMATACAGETGAQGSGAAENTSTSADPLAAIAGLTPKTFARPAWVLPVASPKGSPRPTDA